jgi:hypothetical protein
MQLYITPDMTFIYSELDPVTKMLQVKLSTPDETYKSTLCLMLDVKKLRGFLCINSEEKNIVHKKKQDPRVLL